MADKGDITLLLEQAHEGDPKALDAVGRAVHANLMRQARQLAAKGAAIGGRPLTLEPAELVNETFLKLLRQHTQYKNRQHFFAIATTIMLRVMMDHHKKRRRDKREGNRLKVSLSALEPHRAVRPPVEMPDLVAAFEELDQHDARVAEVAKLRAIWGMSPGEIGEVMGISRSTVDRDWRFGRTWLATRLSRTD